MKKDIVLLLIGVILSACNSPAPKKADIEKHVFYIHGRIIEEQGEEAFSEVYGKYELDSIIQALSIEKTHVHYEIRKSNVDPRQYALKISKQVDSLVNLGIEPNSISVIGASKGAIIASNISDLNHWPINYVLIAGNNDYQETHNNWKFHGQVLAIFDSSDEIAGKNYNHWKKKENFCTKFEQIELNLDLGHGFLYKPLESWIRPTKKWLKSQNLD